MKLVRHAFAAALLLTTFTVAAYAQNLASQQPDEAPFDFYARGPYRQNVPRPASILRYDTGEFHTNYSQMERVIRDIAAAAPERMTITDIGDTNEFRSMHLVVMSSPENMRRINEIKSNIRRLSDPRGLSQTEAQNIISADAARRVARLHDSRQRVGFVRDDDAGRLSTRRVR
jgi:hypothetical protein